MTGPRAPRLAPDHAFVVMAHGDSPFLTGCLASLRAQSLSSRIAVTTSTPSPFIKETAAGMAGTVIAMTLQPFADGG